MAPSKSEEVEQEGDGGSEHDGFDASLTKFAEERGLVYFSYGTSNADNH